MRTRLVYVLAFWLLGAVALSILAMGGVTAWNLREGFTAYLEARDLERFEKFVEIATKQFAQMDLANAAATPPDMRTLLRELAVLDGIPLPNEGSNSNRKGSGRAADQTREAPPPRREVGFASRVSLAKADGTHWVGPRGPGTTLSLIERPIKVGEQTVAIARLRPLQRAPDASETRFLRTQYFGIAAVTVVLLLLSLAAALLLARQWVRPLAAVQAATTRIARGELNVRVPIERSDEIGDVVRNVNVMAESLQRIEGARRQWLANLSHELRTPLAALRGEVEALVDGVRPLNAAAMISLKEEVLRLGVLVDDLHLLAVSDLQSLPCRFSSIDAPELVQAVIQRCQQSAADAGLALSWVGPPSQSDAVEWDAMRIGQLLMNLLHNSIYYTDAPGKIEVSLRSDRDHAYLTVDDSAPGVPSADLVRVFEPLYRADTGRSQRKGGSGLGLAICAAIAKAHGGAITASASALGGLRVEVKLPKNTQAALR